ncbi:hypothetical protein [Nonlabens sp.]|uniref:hypothetical protein n=1 Tax=Nonlabens sp. TaxID=1888209 RepID=UPI003F69670D
MSYVNYGSLLVKPVFHLSVFPLLGLPLFAISGVTRSGAFGVVFYASQTVGSSVGSVLRNMIVASSVYGASGSWGVVSFDDTAFDLLSV